MRLDCTLQVKLFQHAYTEFLLRKKKLLLSVMSHIALVYSVDFPTFRGVCEDPCDNFDPTHNLHIIFNIRRKCCTRIFLSKDSRAD